MTQQFDKDVKRLVNAVTTSKQKKKYLEDRIRVIVEEELKRYGINEA